MLGRYAAAVRRAARRRRRGSEPTVRLERTPEGAALRTGVGEVELALDLEGADGPDGAWSFSAGFLAEVGGAGGPSVELESCGGALRARWLDRGQTREASGALLPTAGEPAPWPA